MKCPRCGWERPPRVRCGNPDCVTTKVKAKKRFSFLRARTREGPRNIVGQEKKINYDAN